MVWTGFEEVGRTALDALDEATKNLASLVETVAEEKPDLVTDVADGQRRMRELRDGLRHILDGADDRYVYSCQVNRSGRGDQEPGITRGDCGRGEARPGDRCRGRAASHARASRWP